jgi:hypothetical protein
MGLLYRETLRWLNVNTPSVLKMFGVVWFNDASSISEDLVDYECYK